MAHEELNLWQPTDTQVERGFAKKAGPPQRQSGGREPINTARGERERMIVSICCGSRRAWCLLARLDKCILRYLVTSS